MTEKRVTLEDLEEIGERLSEGQMALPERGDPITLPAHISEEDWGVSVFGFVQHSRDGRVSFIFHPSISKDFLLTTGIRDLERDGALMRNRSDRGGTVPALREDGELPDAG